MTTRRRTSASVVVFARAVSPAHWATPSHLLPGCLAVSSCLAHPAQTLLIWLCTTCSVPSAACTAMSSFSSYDDPASLSSLIGECQLFLSPATQASRQIALPFLDVHTSTSAWLFHQHPNLSCCVPSAVLLVLIWDAACLFSVSLRSRHRPECVWQQLCSVISWMIHEKWLGRCSCSWRW